MTRFVYDDILKKSQSVETTQKVGLCRLILNGGSEMNAMKYYNSTLLKHSKHSWTECHCTEHSYHENKCWHKNNSSNCKSIFVNGVLA